LQPLAHLALLLLPAPIGRKQAPIPPVSFLSFFLAVQASKLALEAKCREQAQLNQLTAEHVRTSKAAEVRGQRRSTRGRAGRWRWSIGCSSRFMCFLKEFGAPWGRGKCRARLVKNDLSCDWNMCVLEPP